MPPNAHSATEKALISLPDTSLQNSKSSGKTVKHSCHGTKRKSCEQDTHHGKCKCFPLFQVCTVRPSPQDLQVKLCPGNPQIYPGSAFQYRKAQMQVPQAFRECCFFFAIIVPFFSLMLQNIDSKSSPFSIVMTTLSGRQTIVSLFLLIRL